MLGVGELEREGVFAFMSGLSGGAEGLQLALRGAVDLLHLADLGLEGAEERAVRGGESDLLAELRHELVEGLDLGVAVGERLAEQGQLVLEGLALFLGKTDREGMYFDLALFHGEGMDQFRVFLRRVLAARILIAHSSL